uniref:Uncharacterized protein n=1 Tax=Romanomermis culicivorax TaxID=13658 RepID=A0A915L933_ROMCU
MDKHPRTRHPHVGRLPNRGRQIAQVIRSSSLHNVNKQFLDNVRLEKHDPVSSKASDASSKIKNLMREIYDVKHEIKQLKCKTCRTENSKDVTKRDCQCSKLNDAQLEIESLKRRIAGFEEENRRLNENLDKLRTHSNK